MASVLTPEQVLAAQDMFTMIREDALILHDSPAHRRQILAILLEMLDYEEIEVGFFIPRGLARSYTFGEKIDTSKFVNQWDVDRRRVLNDVAAKAEDTDRASTGEPA